MLAGVFFVLFCFWKKPFGGRVVLFMNGRDLVFRNFLRIFVSDGRASAVKGRDLRGGAVCVGWVLSRSRVGRALSRTRKEKGIFQEVSWTHGKKLTMSTVSGGRSSQNLLFEVYTCGDIPGMFFRCIVGSGYYTRWGIARICLTRQFCLLLGLLNSETTY